MLPAPGHRLVHLDLGIVGVDGGIEHPVGARPHIDLQAEVRLPPTPAHPACNAAVRSQRQLGAQFDEAAVAHGRHGLAHALDFAQEGQVAQGIQAQRRAHQERAVGMRNAALDQQAPVLAAAVGEAQVRQRPAHLHAVTVGQTGDSGFDREVRAEVGLVVACPVQAVADHAGQVYPDELGGASVADGIDPDADEVLVEVDLVAPGQRPTHLVRRVVPGPDTEHQGLFVDQQPHRGAQAGRRRLAIARRMLVEAAVGRGALPGRFIELAIDDGGRCIAAMRRAQAASLVGGASLEGERGGQQQGGQAVRGDGHGRGKRGGKNARL